MLPSGSNSTSLLGRDVRRAHVPATSRCIAAQGLVPHGRDVRRRGYDRGAERMLPPGSLRLPDEPYALGCRVRPHCHIVANGDVTNLLVRLGDYATVGRGMVSVVGADSFWIDGYFKETSLEAIQPGDRTEMKLMGYRETLRGHVDSIARGIVVANATPGLSGLATVNPIFTWVRLAQRVPVRIHIDKVPDGVRLVAGMTATVRIEHR